MPPLSTRQCYSAEYLFSFVLERFWTYATILRLLLRLLTFHHIRTLSEKVYIYTYNTHITTYISNNEKIMREYKNYVILFVSI